MIINKLIAVFITAIASISPQKDHEQTHSQWEAAHELTGISAHAQEGFERRVAIDWGSGSIRALLADVNPLSGSYQSLATLSFPLPLSEELQTSVANGEGINFSDKTMQVALDAFAHLKETLALYHPTAYRGIGTAAFRKAENGSAFLKRLRDELGITISLVPQKAEAEIGFLSAASAFSGDDKNLIVWDCGNGSFQLVSRSDEGFDDYGAEIGNLGATTTLIQEVQNKGDGTATPNPVTLEEARALTKVLQSKMPDTPEWLKTKLTEKDTVTAGMGGSHSLFGAFKIVSNQGIAACSKDTIWNIIGKLLDKTDAQISTEFPLLPEPHKALGKLVLLYSVMEKTGIDHIDANYRLAGSTQGIATYPLLWVQ